MIRSSIAKSHLAHAIRRGDDPEHITELRTAYYHARACEYLTRLIADRRLTPDQCRDLADMLGQNGGGADGN